MSRISRCHCLQVDQVDQSSKQRTPLSRSGLRAQCNPVSSGVGTPGLPVHNSPHHTIRCVRRFPPCTGSRRGDQSASAPAPATATAIPPSLTRCAHHGLHATRSYPVVAHGTHIRFFSAPAPAAPGARAAVARQLLSGSRINRHTNPRYASPSAAPTTRLTLDMM